MRDPFKIEGPACISFSGGRTSGYMLWRILQAHGGKLPDDVVVCFANTGKEAEETLHFVGVCSDAWQVPITWLEFNKSAPVDFLSASRDGEPFEALINKKRYLPNTFARFCTQELKINVIARHMKSLGLNDWLNFVGMRADEPRRVAKLNRVPCEWTSIAPLYEAGETVEHVNRFWSNSSFKLRLDVVDNNTLLSNCDLCFLKTARHKLNLIRQNPDMAIWWMNQEKKIGGVFRQDHPSYAAMYEMATKHGELFSFDDDPLEDCACTD